VNFITCISVALFVIFKNAKNPLNVSFFNLNFSVALYSFGYFFWQLARSEGQAIFWFKFTVVGIILINITYLYFVFHFLELIDKKRRLLRVCAFINFIFIILNIQSYFYARFEPRYNLGFWPVPTILFTIYLMFWFWQCSYGFYWLLKGLKLYTGLKRQQIKYFTISAIFGFVGGATNWPMWYKIHFPPYLNITISLYIGIVAYAIFRYRLLEINLALTRIGVFVIVYTLVLGIPFWLGYTTKLWFPATMLAVLLATIGPFVYQLLRKHAENILFKDRQRYQLALIELSKTMGRIRDLDKLYKTIVLTVYDTIKVPFAGIYLKDEEYKSYQLKHYFPKKSQSNFQEFVPLDYPLVSLLNQQKRPLLSEETGTLDKIRLDHGLVIPCFIEDDLLGFLVLGPKPNNQMYTQDDLLVFETLSYSTSLAIENCKFWKEIEDRQRKARLEEMDTFAYSLAHEIDNPMTIVLNLSTLLKKHFLKYISDPNEQKEVEDTCGFLIEASKRVSGMVKAIRQFGEKTTGELIPLNLQEAIEGYCKLFLPELKANSVFFNKEIPVEPIYIKGVAAELQQVLIILSKNSIHAMKYSGTKKITLTVIKVNHDTVRIAFSDTGYGIKPEKTQTIFAPFVTTKASTEGTGMGLYNAKGFILRHKGKIWAESEGDHKGATFIIELPVIKDVKPENLPKTDEKRWKF